MLFDPLVLDGPLLLHFIELWLFGKHTLDVVRAKPSVCHLNVDFDLVRESVEDVEVDFFVFVRAVVEHGLGLVMRFYDFHEFRALVDVQQHLLDCFFDL